MTTTEAAVPPSVGRSPWRRVGLIALAVALLPLWIGYHSLLAYGGAVALTPTRHHAVEYAFIEDDGRTVGVAYMHGECEILRRAHLVEQSAERVVVGITYRADSPSGVCVAIGYPKVALFRLDEPLGDRKLYYDSDQGLRPVRVVGVERPPMEVEFVVE